MAEVRFCMFADVCLKLLPVTRVIANLLAPCANRYQAVQRPHLSQGVPQLFDNLLALQFPLFFSEMPRKSTETPSRNGYILIRNQRHRSTSKFSDDSGV